MQPPDHGLSRRDRERLLRREAMMRAACALFAEKGYARTSLEEIATRAEFGKGTLYNYFPEGKEEILLAIFEELFDNLVALIETTFGTQPEKSFRDRMHMFLERCFGFYNERANLFLILIREAHRVGLAELKKNRSFFMHQRSRVLEVLADPIQEAIDAGELKDDIQATFLAHLILTNIQSCQMQFCFDAPGSTSCHPPNGELMADFLTGMIFDGVARRDTTPA